MADTFSDLAAEYLEHHAKVKKKSWKKDEQAINRDLLPRFGRLHATEINRRDVLKVLAEIRERGAPIVANRTLALMSRMYNWGISREIVKDNPCRGIESPSPEKTRERVLADDEIRAVWNAFRHEPQHFASMFKLRLLTAQRGGEVSRMRWQDIDGDWWTIPPEFSKNGMAHRVPLSKSATEILESMRPVSGHRKWVFPNHAGDGPIINIWKSARRINEGSGVDFVPHDIRRTAASRMTGDLKINRLVVAKILNHAESGVIATYDRHSYDEEKRHALEAWASRLQQILDGKPAPSNVVQIGSKM